MNSGSGHRLHECCAHAGREFSTPSTKRKYERSRPFITTHLALDVDVLFEEQSIQARAELDFHRRAEQGQLLELDAYDFQIRRVLLKVEGAERELHDGSGYQYDGETLQVPIDQHLNSGQLVVEYRVTPRLGLYFLAPDDKVPSRPVQVWSQCQDEDGHYWFPCQDKPHVKMTTELRARVPLGMKVLSNGALVTAQDDGSRSEFHYRLDSPQPAYLITLVAGYFDEWTESCQLPSGREVTLRFLVPPGEIEAGRRAFARTAHMMRLLSERTGVEYPWPSYAQVVVHDFIFGGMENTTATTMYEHILLDETAAIDIDSYDLVVHELAHQWFGDLVTCRDWSQAWLNEGFATFSEHIEKEDRLGRDGYDHSILVDLEAYLGEAHTDYQRPIVCRDYDEPIDLFDRHLYQKGGLVLHMLRRKLGSDLFWRGVRTYLERYALGIVDTPSFMRAMEEVSGTSLERFFDEWLYRPGHPRVTVKVGYEAGLLDVTVEQTPSTKGAATFELDFEIAVCVDGNWTRHRRTIDSAKDALTLQLEQRPKAIEINPELRFIGEISLEAPEDMLIAALASAPEAHGRVLAATTLKTRATQRAAQALATSLQNESETWMVRAAAAESIGYQRGPNAVANLQAALHTAEPRVRRAIAKALGHLGTQEARAPLQQLLEDPSYLVRASAARAFGTAQLHGARETLEPLLQSPSWAEVIRSGAIDGLAKLEGDESIGLLLPQSEYGQPQRSRRAAIAALGRIGEGRKVREHLERLLRDRDPHVRISVVKALGDLSDSRAQGALQELLDGEPDGRVRSAVQTALARLATDKREALISAKRQLGALEGELRSMKVRLSRLEQLEKKPKKKRKNKGK